MSKPDYNRIATSLKKDLETAQTAAFSPLERLEYLESIRENADKPLKAIHNRRLMWTILGTIGIAAAVFTGGTAAAATILPSTLALAIGTTAAALSIRGFFSLRGDVLPKETINLVAVREDVVRAGNDILLKNHKALAAQPALKDAFQRYANLEARFAFAQGGTTLYVRPWDNWKVEVKPGKTSFIN